MKNQFKMRYKIIVILLFTLCSSVTYAQTKFDHSFEKEEKVSANDEVRISSSHNSIEVNTWDDALIKVVIIGNVEADSKADADKLFELFDADIERIGNTINVDLNLLFERAKKVNTKNGKTTVEFKNGKSLKFGKYTFEVEVFVPRQNKLHIANKFGNVSLGNMEGATSIELSSSTLKANNFKALTIDAQFSTINISNADKADLEATSTTFNAGNISTLKCKSSFSTLTLGNLVTMELQSSSDTYNLASVGSISGETAFATFNFGKLQKRMELDAQSSNINVGSVSNNFENISLDSDFATIILNMEKGSSYQLSADTHFSSVSTPDSKGLVRKKEMSKESIEGYVGDQNAGSSVSINCKSCTVVLK